MNAQINIDSCISFSIETAAAPDISRLTLPISVRQLASSSYMHSIDPITVEKALLQKYECIKNVHDGNAKHREIIADRRSKLAESSKRESAERARVKEQEAQKIELEKERKRREDEEASHKQSLRLGRLENMRVVLEEEYRRTNPSTSESLSDLSDDTCTYYVNRAHGNVTEAVNSYRVDCGKLKVELKKKKSEISDDEVKGYIEMASQTSGVNISDGSFNIVSAAVDQYNMLNY